MKRLFLHELQEQSKTLQETFSKKYFHGKKDEKSISYKYYGR